MTKTCGQLARSERDIAAVIRAQTGEQPDGPVGVAALDVVDLAERLDAVVPVVRDVLDPVTRLERALTEVRSRLDQDVAAARAAAERALARATRAERDADAARADAVEADTARDDAERRATVAEDTARDAREGRERAERARATAEGRAVELRSSLALADERNTALAERVTDLGNRLAHQAGQLATTQDDLVKERQRADTEQDRATAATAATVELERTLHERLDETRTRFDRDLAALRKTARNEHDTALAALHQRIGSLAEQVRTIEADRDTRLGELRTALTTALAPDADPVRLSTQFGHLLDGD